MSPPSISPSGDSDKPANSFFVPPPIQRLSRSFSGFSFPSHSHSHSDPPSILPFQSTPLPGPNRAPSLRDPLPSSSKPSNIFPRLHRLEIADDMANGQKKPLLELQLSSSSFLDAVATAVESQKSLYAVETVGASTTIWRSDPWDGSAKIADIRWPKDLPLKGKGRDHAQGAMIQMDDLRWKETTTLLKHSGLGSSSRKFCVPHYPHTLRWKRDGNVYLCMTSSCKGVVATLDSFNSSDTAPRLRVFETLANFHQSVPQLDHAGISLYLLDHLFVTALLLVTEPEDWMTLSRNPTSLDGQSSQVPASFRVASINSASNRQWRKIMYGEPMYPSLKTPSFDKCVDNGGEDADVLDISEPPQLSTSRRQWRKIVYGEPLYPSLRSQSADGLDLPPRPSTATSFSSESAYSPPTPSSAPSTRFYDERSLFDDTERAHPRNGDEPRRGASPLALSSGTLSPLPSSECIRLSPLRISTPPCARRELPSPPSSYQPPPSIQPWLHRSRSSPKLSLSAQSPISTGDDPDDPAHQSLLTRIATSMNVRQLPTPPQREMAVQTAQAQIRPTEAKRLSQTHQRSLPPTPASSMSRSSSAHPSMSQEGVLQSLPVSVASRPPIVQPGPSVAMQTDAARRARHEKDPNEVVNWMRSITRAHRRRAVEGDDDAESGTYEDSVYEAPPPAYNAIDFSTPPQARSPPEGARG